MKADLLKFFQFSGIFPILTLLSHKRVLNEKWARRTSILRYEENNIFQYFSYFAVVFRTRLKIRCNSRFILEFYYSRFAPSVSSEFCQIKVIQSFSQMKVRLPKSCEDVFYHSISEGDILALKINSKIISQF